MGRGGDSFVDGEKLVALFCDGLCGAVGVYGEKPFC
jgi:hypothetical protein